MSFAPSCSSSFSILHGNLGSFAHKYPFCKLAMKLQCKRLCLPERYCCFCMFAVNLSPPPRPPPTGSLYETLVMWGVFIAIKWENRCCCEWTVCRVVIGGKSIEFLLGINGELKCLRPVHFVFVAQISVIWSQKYELGPGASRYRRFWHSSSTWRDTAILSYPSIVFNLFFCVVL